MKDKDKEGREEFDKQDYGVPKEEEVSHRI